VYGAGVRLKRMDKVRFGRALGYGARHAAKSLAKAVDAATSPDPNPRRKAAVSEHVSQVAEGLRQVSAAKREIKAQAVTHAKRSLLGPLKRFSSVLWLEVTGSFFALFALTMGAAVLRHRDYFRLPMASEDGRKIYFYLLAFAVFGYFTVSNFVRANRRQSRR
jgi:hypothetical protein